MKNNTRYVTQIENDIRRILKTLLSKNAHIEIDQDNDTTVIIGTYESRRNVYMKHMMEKLQFALVARVV